MKKPILTEHIKRNDTRRWLLWTVGFALLAACIPLPPARGLTPGTIYRKAGGGNGDGGAATQAALYGPQGIVADAAGNVYISDTGQNAVRKVTPQGVITTYAGGFPSYTTQGLGDGGLATQATVGSPMGLALDAAGNLYIAEPFSCRIRKVTPEGFISTVAGKGPPPYDFGDSGEPMPSYTFTGDGGQASQAQLYNPTDVALDGRGNLFIADAGNLRIRKVDNSGIISTVAGSGKITSVRFGNLPEGAYGGDGGPATAADLNFPSSVAADANGALYIADTRNGRIRKVDSNGIITTIAGTGKNHTPVLLNEGGLAKDAEIFGPLALSLDDAGNLYFSDGGVRVRKIDPKGIITTLAGNGTADPYGQGGFTGDNVPATKTQLNAVHDVVLTPSGELLIADSGNHRVRKVGTDGIISTVAGTGEYDFAGEGIPALGARVHGVAGLAFDPAGNLFFADAGNHRVRKIGLDGITTVAGAGAVGYEPGTGKSLGSFGGDGGPARKAYFRNPQDVQIDSGGNLLISDTGNQRVRKVAPDGTITTIAGNDHGNDVNGNPLGYFGGDNGPSTGSFLYAPSGLTLDRDNNLLIADTLNFRIRKIDPSGTITTLAGAGPIGVRDDGSPYSSYDGDGGPALKGHMRQPLSVASDSSGTLFIADQYDGVVRKVDTEGILTRRGTVGYLNGVAVDSAGQIFVARGQDVAMIGLDNRVTAVAGRPYEGTTIGVPQEGSPATLAPFSNATHVAIDRDGNLWVGDDRAIYEVIRVAAPGRVAGRNLPGNGDANQDGKVDLKDVLLALQASIGAITLSPVAFAFGDTDANERVDLGDVTAILRTAIGL